MDFDYRWPDDTPLEGAMLRATLTMVPSPDTAQVTSHAAADRSLPSILPTQSMPQTGSALVDASPETDDGPVGPDPFSALSVADGALLSTLFERVIASREGQGAGLDAAARPTRQQTIASGDRAGPMRSNVSARTPGARGPYPAFANTLQRPMRLATLPEALDRLMAPPPLPMSSPYGVLTPVYQDVRHVWLLVAVVKREIGVETTSESGDGADSRVDPRAVLVGVFERLGAAAQRSPRTLSMSRFASIVGVSHVSMSLWRRSFAGRDAAPVRAFGAALVTHLAGAVHEFERLYQRVRREAPSGISNLAGTPLENRLCSLLPTSLLPNVLLPAAQGHAAGADGHTRTPAASASD